ncbi:MAG: prepilin-type N-terminal cleavage/methylation domain-containing protein [Patescibacteria group bacterium]
MDFSKHSYNSKSGFSVIEVLVSIFILTLIGFAVYSFQKDVFSLNRIISDGLTAQNEARRALKSMSAEIRTVSPSSLGAYALTQTATSSFTFYSNIDDDSFKERVRYFLDGATLKKGVIKPSGAPLTYNPVSEVISEIVHDVANATSSIFSYYDANYDGVTQPLAEPIDIVAVRLVKITVAIDKDSQTSPGPITLTTQISMRNLKDNL